MTTNQTKIIDVVDVQAGRLTERVVDHNPPIELNERAQQPLNELGFRLRETAVRNRLNSLQEAFVLLPQADVLLRDGIRYISFNSFNGTPTTYTEWMRVEQSNRPQEEYLRDATMGMPPRVPSGTPVPFANSTFDGAVTIPNHRYAQGVIVTMDDIRFDRLGKIRQIADELGRSFRMQEEQQAYNLITTAANFTRNSTTGDNDVGANTAATTFSAAGFETAYTTIATSKDRHSGQYLGLVPDTIVCGVRSERYIRQFLFSDTLARTHGNTSAEVTGTGTNNPYRGLIRRIIVSPFVQSFAWAMCDSTRMSAVFQRVEGLNIMQEAMNASSEAYLLTDSIRYVASSYFGVGMVDDRPWYYSSSSTTPVVS